MATTPKPLPWPPKWHSTFAWEFNKDVVVDLICYRKHGHSEADEPFATQPDHVPAYSAIIPALRHIYTEKLVAEGLISGGDAEAMATRYVDALENNEVVSRPYANVIDNRFSTNFEAFRDNRLAHRSCDRAQREAHSNAG